MFNIGTFFGRKKENKAMKYLVRIYHTNKDKQNENVNTLERALQLIGKQENEVYLRVNWLNFTDLFFIGTNDYIRINNNK